MIQQKTKLIQQGAEATINEITYNGKTAIQKQRNTKKYRKKELDEKITKERTKKEAKLIQQANNIGIRVPKIYETNLEQKIIIMEKIEGKKIKEIIEQKTILLKKIGKIIGILHKNQIIHGDLTTSNMIYEEKTNQIGIIDFGLGYKSKKIEDYATDLLVLKKTFNATHSKIMNKWPKILEGYKEEMQNSEIIIKQIEKIEKRARYH